MRFVLLVLPLAGLVAADDPFPANLRVFEEARKETLKPANTARITKAVAELVATGDVRAVSPLVKYLAETFALEEQILARRKVAESQRVASTHRKRNLSRDLEFLQAKERAGDEAAGSKIKERVAAAENVERSLAEAQEQAFVANNALEFVQGLRPQLAAGVTEVLKGLAGDEATGACAAVNRALDASKRAQGLHLVEILRASGRPEAEGPLLEVIVNEGVDEAVLSRAQYALVKIMTRMSAEVLLRIWEKDPDGRGKNVGHVLSMAAKKRLATPSDARKWIETLPR